ncbi:hypothetical protein [Nannocystis pusilla]|uniref:hypothetical protein n=1 Tax=Nannocystis pusilla TaxID=889268 RepID=UPI003B81182D
MSPTPGSMNTNEAPLPRIGATSVPTSITTRFGDSTRTKPGLPPTNVLRGSCLVAIAEARQRRPGQDAATALVEGVDLLHQDGGHRLAHDRLDLRDAQSVHRGEKWHSRRLTASGNLDKLFRDPAMAPKRDEQLHRAGFTVRGELRFASDLKGAGDVMESFASRFVVEARGRWRTAVARPANAIGMSMEAGGIESEFHSHVESQLVFQVRGELTCEASNALWIVPPQSALWVPGA